MDLKSLCLKAKEASYELAQYSSDEKNAILNFFADHLVLKADEIMLANELDIKSAIDKPSHFIDRLKLDKKRISSIADGLKALMAVGDPVNKILEEYVNHCGLKIQKVSVPLGVIGIIYEARPNVTADAAGLCIKSGNSVILRGSKDAINSNIAIVKILKEALVSIGKNPECIQIITDTERKSAEEMMKANGLIDVLIPRGGAGLIETVVKNSSVPVIETGSGNCHIYINEFANIKMAEEILLNAKLSRPSVCNSAEKLLIDESIASKYLPQIIDLLRSNNVAVKGCNKTINLVRDIIEATEEDFYKEYNDYIITIKITKDIDEAIKHINKYSSKHSDAIITENNDYAEKFLNYIDSAAVYVNASTRFTDGFEFGFGAEMGISTQKLHARGPMGLRELNSYKYKVIGNGQIRK